MPGRKKNKKEKTNALTAYFDGKYGHYQGPYQAERCSFDAQEVMSIIDPSFRDEWFNYYSSSYTEKCEFAEEKIGLAYYSGKPKLNRVVEDIDEEYKMFEYNSRLNKKLGDYIKKLDGDGLAFAPLFEATRKSADYESGDLTRAMYDSPVISGMNTVLAYGVRIFTKKVEKTDEEIQKEAAQRKIPVNRVDKEKDVFDFERMKQGLGAAFLPYMEMYSDYNALIDLEFEKQRIEDTHADAETEADFKARYKLQLEKTVKDFKTLKQVEVDNPRVYNSSVLNNALDELVGVSPSETRTIEKEIGFMEGQIKAIENGWSLEDSSVLGIIGSFDVCVEKTKAEFYDYLARNERTIESNIKKLEDVQKELEAYGEVKLTTDQVKALRQPYKKEIKAYESYARDLRIMKDKGTSEAEILKFKRNKEGIVKNFEKVEEELRIKTGIAGLNRYYDLKTKQEDLMHNISRDSNIVKDCRKKAPDIEKIYSEIKKLKEESYGKKIVDLNDSREVLKKLESFIERNRNVENATSTLYEDHFCVFEKMIEASKERLERGRISEYGAEGENFHLNKTYGSKPLSEKYPFNETEVSAIIEGGKQDAEPAMESYAAGDKKPLAACIYNGYLTIQKELKEAGKFDDKAVYYLALLDSYNDILKRDSALRKELTDYNSLKPENERLDFDGLRSVQTLARTVVQGRNAKKELNEKRELLPLEKALLIKKREKGEKNAEFKWDEVKNQTEFEKINEETNNKELLSEIIEPEPVKENDAENLIIPANTAYTYIKDLRDNGFKVVNTSYHTKEVKDDYGDKFLKIIAARQLAGAEGKNVQKLKAFEITPRMVDDRVTEMKRDKVFRGFISSIKNSRDKMITAITAAKLVPGHGEKLENMLKEYMLELPPGEMKNNKLSERYLPKADKRIESLQKQVEKLRKKNPATQEEYRRNEDRIVKAVAEIIGLRNLSQAEAGNKASLVKKLPCKASDTLKDGVEALSEDEGFRFTALQREVQDLVLKGHGGKMTLKVRELYSQRLDKDDRISDIIDANTIEKRMAKLKHDAGELAASIRGAAAGSAQQNKLVQDGKNLMEEYSFLFAKVVDPDTFTVEQDKLKKDVPWQKVRELKTKDTTFTQKFRYVTGFFNENDIAECLDSMSTQGLAEFKTSVNAKINAVSARINNHQNQADNLQADDAHQNPVQAGGPKKNKAAGRQKK